MSNIHGVGWLDTTGAYAGFKNIDGKPRVSTMAYLFDMAEGNISGHTPWVKIGYNPVVGTTEEDVWSNGGTYVFCTTAGKWEVVSSDNTQDIGTSIKSGTSTGGSTTTLIDSGANFNAATAVAVGDCVILDKSGTTPEWGYVTEVTSDTTLTLSGGFSSGGTGSGRAYNVIDKSAYTNAQAVKIEYLTSAYATKSEIVIMNGTTAVDTVNTDLFRVNSFRIIATGTNNNCLGNITLSADGAGTTYSFITAGFTRARNIIYTVPAGKTLYITHWSASYSTTGNANKEYGRMYTRANIEPSTKFKTGSLFYPYTEIAMQNATTVIEFSCPTKIPATTDIKVSGVATANGAMSTVLRGWIE
jgi:hypothetical protein